MRSAPLNTKPSAIPNPVRFGKIAFLAAYLIIILLFDNPYAWANVI